jgi:1-acyl-sn-glycerol-3-phosphate acyltransferase
MNLENIRPEVVSKASGAVSTKTDPIGFSSLSSREIITHVKSYWREKLEIGPWLGEDICVALIQRFLSRVRFYNPKPFLDLRGKGVLYVANHQVGVESFLFIIVMSALQGIMTAALAKKEHATSWLGELKRVCFENPAVKNLSILKLADRFKPLEILQAFTDSLDKIAANQYSLLVHTEGTRALVAPKAVEQISSTLIDLAVEKNVPIVPVRFVGGLPMTPLRKRIEFPVGFGKQEIWIGPPIKPKMLFNKSSSQRQELVLKTMNGFSGKWREDFFSAPDVDFQESVERYNRKFCITETQAVLYRAVKCLEAPSPQLAKLIAAMEEIKNGVQLLDINCICDRWLASCSEALFGIQMHNMLDQSA